MSEEDPRQNYERGFVDLKLVEAPSNFIAGCSKAAFLFWFFGELRCGVPLFVLYVIYVVCRYLSLFFLYKNR